MDYMNQNNMNQNNMNQNNMNQNNMEQNNMDQNNINSNNINLNNMEQMQNGQQAYTSPEMVFDSVCTGYYLEVVTTDYQRFNNLMAQGYPMGEILQTESRGPLAYTFGYHLIYTYEVNGFRFVRASSRICYRRDRYFALAEKMNKPYVVKYNSQRPFESEIEERLDESPYQNVLTKQMDMQVQYQNQDPEWYKNPWIFQNQQMPSNGQGITSSQINSNMQNSVNMQMTAGSQGFYNQQMNTPQLKKESEIKEVWVCFILGIIFPLVMCTLIGPLITGTISIVYYVKAQKKKNQIKWKALPIIGLLFAIIGILIALFFLVFFVLDYVTD